MTRFDLIEMLPFIILGNGGHARVVASMLRALGADIQGCVVPADEAAISEIPILGDDAWLLQQSRQGIYLANGVGSVRPSLPRVRVFVSFAEAGFHFPAIVHPKAIVDQQVHLGDGCQVMAGAIVQSGGRIGANAIVNTGAVVDHDCDIGDNCHIAPGATLSGTVTMGTGAHVGTGATVLQNITIGSRALVAAGAVVIRHVDAGESVAGVPAQKMTK